MILAEAAKAPVGIDMPTALTIAGAVCAVLVAAIKTLDKRGQERERLAAEESKALLERAEAKFDACEARDRNTTEQLHGVQVELASMGSRIDGYNEARTDMAALSDYVLKELKKREDG